MSGSDPPQGRHGDTVVPFRQRGPRPGRPEQPSATEYVVVDCRFRNDPQVQALPPTAKFVFVYLMTGPQCNPTGIYPDDPDTFVADLGITKAAYRRAQRALVKANVLELSSRGPIKARGGRLLWVKPDVQVPGHVLASGVRVRPRLPGAVAAVAARGGVLPDLSSRAGAAPRVEARYARGLAALMIGRCKRVGKMRSANASPIRRQPRDRR